MTGGKIRRIPENRRKGNEGHDRKERRTKEEGKKGTERKEQKRMKG
jgi:hypothetical protein